MWAAGTSHLDACRPHFDVVIAGEAENLWPQFLKEWDGGEHKRGYTAHEFIAINKTPAPRSELLPVEKYLSGIVQASRECPDNCGFGDVTALFGRQCRYMHGHQVIEKTSWFVERGAIGAFLPMIILSAPKKARAILERLVALNDDIGRSVAYVAPVPLTVAEDEELLALFRKAGFIALFCRYRNTQKRAWQLSTSKPI